MTNQQNAWKNLSGSVYVGGIRCTCYLFMHFGVFLREKSQSDRKSRRHVIDPVEAKAAGSLAGAGIETGS